jgi:hypothetical protein
MAENPATEFMVQASMFFLNEGSRWRCNAPDPCAGAGADCFGGIFTIKQMMIFQGTPCPGWAATYNRRHAQLEPLDNPRLWALNLPLPIVFILFYNNFFLFYHSLLLV